MFLNILSIDFVTISLLGLFVILSLYGFIGNLNINSDDGSVNINGSNLKTVLIDEAEEDIDPSKASTLNIINPIGNVKVITNSANKLHLNKKLYSNESITEMEKTELKSVFKESTLSVNDDTISLQVPKLTTMDVLSVKVDLVVSIPESFSVTMEPGVNDLTIQDLGGNLDLSHNVGNIALVNIAGVAKIKSNSSNVIAENIENLAYLVVNAGNISVKSAKIVSKESVINVNAGNVELDIDEISNQSECNVEAGAGEIFVTINKDAGLSLKAVSSIGSISIGSGITILSEEKQFMGASITAKLNDPQGNLFVNSNTGNINIKLR